MKKIYLAGPDVFRPDAKEYGKELVRICSDYGFEGKFPLDNEINLSGLTKQQMSKAIFDANVEMLTSCDIILANLQKFRGPSADVGTVWECAYGNALGKLVVGYNVDYDCDYKNYVIGSVKHDGMSIEDFGGFDNLMLVHGCSKVYKTLDYALSCI